MRFIAATVERVNAAKVGNDKSYFHATIADYKLQESQLLDTEKELSKMEKSNAIVDAAYNGYKGARESLHHLQRLRKSHEIIAEAMDKVKQLKNEYEEKMLQLSTSEEEASVYVGQPSAFSMESKRTLQTSRLSLTIQAKNQALKIADLIQKQEAGDTLSIAKQKYLLIKENLNFVQRKLEGLSSNT
jgi:hypothetical protein